jgi:hypothetical protein
MKIFSYAMILMFLIMFPFLQSCKKHESKFMKDDPVQTCKPYTRWWWFASEIKPEDVRSNLDWAKNYGFGGVEIAWVYPLNRVIRDTVNYTPRQEWLSKEWSDIVTFTKQYADSIGLGCDFTFGTLWPFGDSYVPRHEASMNWNDTNLRQDIRASWQYPKKGLVIDHLSSTAFNNYAQRLNKAFGDAYKGSKSCLFVDSWEVDTKWLWTPGFDKKFQQEFGYDIRPYMDSIYTKAYSDYRYDYMSLISAMVIDQFYNPFADNAHQNGCYARGQIAGAPTDIITAYALMDVPETEAMLYEPSYSRIVASAALLGKHDVVSSETFTCLYGWPRNYRCTEQTADLKLIADALFANGVNHIIWHGMPFNPKGIDTVKFYATAHVGAKGSLSEEIPAFNQYMENISCFMRKGKTYSDVAMYLPLEDAWMAGEMPDSLKFPWAWAYYEMRYVVTPPELKGYQPLWINTHFLREAQIKDGFLVMGNATFSSLYVDAAYLDIDALKTILGLAKQGLPVCLKKDPSQPGKAKSAEYGKMLKELKSLKNVSAQWANTVKKPPLVEGKNLIDFWCRKTKDKYIFFFSNPLAQNLHLPLMYGQSLNTKTITQEVVFNIEGKKIPYKLVFEPYQSILLKIDASGKVELQPTKFVPKTPVVDGKKVKAF